MITKRSFAPASGNSLRPEASRDEITKLCREAARFGFASVCINPWYVGLAAELLHGTSVKVCTVVGFPLGATLPQVKVYETEEAIKVGAQEIDMVQNVGGYAQFNVGSPAAAGIPVPGDLQINTSRDIEVTLKLAHKKK